MKRIKYLIKSNTDLILYILYSVAILALAFALNRFFQMLMFILFFETIQNCFNKRFHADTIFIDEPIKAVKYCKIITIVIELVYLYFCKDLNTSIYSNLVVIFLIATINALLEFYCERTIVKKCRLKNLDSLLILCEEANLTQLATNRMIMRFVEKKSYEEIADLEFVDVETIRKSIMRSKKKIFS